MRYLYAITKRESLTPIYNIVNCLRVEEGWPWLLLVLFYKVVVRAVGSEYIIERFTCMAGVHAYSTRNRSHWSVIPMHKT